jgi:hypothetical protein
LAVGQEGKLPLSTFGYPYQQLVTILTKKTEAGIFKNFIAIAFKKISYPLSTISYPHKILKLIKKFHKLSKDINYN